MGCYQAKSPFAFHDQIVTWELACKGWLSHLRSPIVGRVVPTTLAGVEDSGQLSPDDLIQLVGTLACWAQVAYTAYQRSRNLQLVIRPFLSRATWSEALDVARRGEHSLPAETCDVSILRLDIVDFTELTQTHPLDQVVWDLNVYLDTMTQLVHRHSGDVNKFLGDGFLSIFATADNAVQAGRVIQQASAHFNRRQSVQGGLVFLARVGIDTGQAAIVSLGSPDRLDRTIIGTPVNIAERLQEKAVPGRVWLSQATFERLRDKSNCHCLGPVLVKGQQEPIVVHEIR